MKIDNLVIENQSPEFAVELKKFWKSMGVYIIWFDFSQNKKDGCTEIYYGVINGKFDNYFKKNIPPHVRIFHHIPTLAELGLEDITFPCDMEVWDEDGDKKIKRKVIMTFEHNAGKRYVEFFESANKYFVWKNATPIPKTLPLTLSELLNIASEVKGVQVTLKEVEK